MTARELTDRQQRVLRVLTDEWELSYDIAQKAEVDNRAVGSVLKSLERRDLARRRWISPDALYEWRRLG